MPDQPELKREDVYRRPLIDGRRTPTGLLARLGRRSQSLLVSRREREEAVIEARLRAPITLSRSNFISVSSLRGGSGTTTVAMLLGSLFASHRRLWTIVVDANPSFGPLTSLAPVADRPRRALGDLLGELDSIGSAAQLGEFVGRTPTGAHLLGGPSGTEMASNVAPERFRELLDFLARLYAVVVVDSGSGGRHPLAQLATERADQSVVVTPPDPASAGPLEPFLASVDASRTTVVCNRPPQWKDDDSHAVEQLLAPDAAPDAVDLPYDSELADQLPAGEYALERLRSQTRRPIKRVAAHAVERLV